MSTTSVTLAATVGATALCLCLAGPGIATAEPIPDIPDIPEIDETFALNYALDHQREICSILHYRFAQADPAIYPMESIITETAARGNFNYETAGFVIGAAMASSCPQFIEPVEEALGIEIA